mmetsp:Transcript_5396/g.9926  ORF Transcript_5396/g.9926 Transcript_5396/m.9926 type:complete len:336 (-) Transcript_5396:158-1165(-)
MEMRLLADLKVNFVAHANGCQERIFNNFSRVGRRRLGGFAVAHKAHDVFEHLNGLFVVLSVGFEERLFNERFLECQQLVCIVSLSKSENAVDPTLSVLGQFIAWSSYPLLFITILLFLFLPRLFPENVVSELDHRYEVGGVLLLKSLIERLHQVFIKASRIVVVVRHFLASFLLLGPLRRPDLLVIRIAERRLLEVRVSAGGSCSLRLCCSCLLGFGLRFGLLSSESWLGLFLHFSRSSSSVARSGLRLRRSAPSIAFVLVRVGQWVGWYAIKAFGFIPVAFFGFFVVVVSLAGGLVDFVAPWSDLALIANSLWLIPLGLLGHSVVVIPFARLFV